MGNKLGSRRKSTGSTEDPNKLKRKKKKGNKKGLSSIEEDKNKHFSCPEFTGAVPYPQRDNVQINYKLRRSYRDLDSSRYSMGAPDPEIKIYRRSTSGLPKSSTLPRNFGRSKSEAVPNGTVHGYPEFDRPRGWGGEDTVDSGGSEPRSRDSRRASLSSSSSAPGKTNRRAPPVTPADFPSTSDIKRKLEIFEAAFVRSLVSNYQELPDTLQLSALAFAMKKGNQNVVSLLEYMNGENVPFDLLSVKNNNESYILMVPVALFHGVAHARRDKLNDMRLWCSLAQDIAMCVGMEAAREISRMYEYQIVILFEDASVRVLADHAAQCVLAYIKSTNAYLDRNTAIIGVVKGKPPGAEDYKYVSAILGDREMKWELFEVLKRPGLRKELALVSDDALEADVESVPWQFYTSGMSVPMTYGYRGQLIEWDFVYKVYKLNSDDDSMYDEIVDFRPDDFHRLYIPYKRLVGLEVMQNFCHKASSGKTNKTLSEYMVTEVDLSNGREQVEAIYRPLSPAKNTLLFSNVRLDNTDMTRAQLEGVDLSQASIRNARLVLADVDNTNMAGTRLNGSDMSYSDLSSAVMTPERLRDVTATHVTMDDSFSSGRGSYGSPDSARSPMNTSIISDGEGKIIPVDQAIQERQKRVEEEAAKKAKAEQERAEREKAKRERLEKERADREKAAKEKAKKKKVPTATLR